MAVRGALLAVRGRGGDNAQMNQDTPFSATAETPVVHEANGELSLHFDFPTIQSRMLRAEPDRLVLDYTRTMMGFLLFQPRPERIAMIGLGGGSLAKYCHRRLPDSDFTAVEIAPQVIALREQFGIPGDSPRFRVLCADGADFVGRQVEDFDVLLVDGFDRGGQPSQLCSPAFYDRCYAALRPRGVLVVNLCADDTGYGRYMARISASFAEKVIVIEADEGENKIVFAGKARDFPPQLGELAERLRELEARHPVELDRTAQKILRAQEANKGRRGRHR